MMRLFIALPLASGIQQQIGRLQMGVPNARWVRPENMHVTLCFLGDVSEMRLDGLDHALRPIAASQFRFKISGIGHFGTRRKVHALWVGVDGGEALIRLHAKIDRAVRSIGLEPDSRKFQPHVTLARLREAPLNKITQYMGDYNLFRTEPVLADHFALFQSTLGHRAAQYEAIKTYNLQEVD